MCLTPRLNTCVSPTKHFERALEEVVIETWCLCVCIYRMCSHQSREKFSTSDMGATCAEFWANVSGHISVNTQTAQVCSDIYPVTLGFCMIKTSTQKFANELVRAKLHDDSMRSDCLSMSSSGGLSIVVTVCRICAVQRARDANLNQSLDGKIIQHRLCFKL